MEILPVILKSAIKTIFTLLIITLSSIGLSFVISIIN